MDDFGQDDTGRRAWELLSHPIRSIYEFVSTPFRGGERILRETSDRTVISEDGSIDTSIGRRVHYADCNHAIEGHIGGRCSFCEGIVCRQCFRQCLICGRSLCPTCSVPNSTGQVLCRYCAEEVAYCHRMSQIGGTIMSLFVESKDIEERGE